MDNNPNSDGQIRRHTDAIVRAIVVAMAIVVAWNVGIIYPTVQLAWSKRKRRS